MPFPSLSPEPAWGDVTALIHVSLPSPFTYDLVLGAIGSQIHGFSLPDGRPRFTVPAVLPDSIRCHGLSTCLDTLHSTNCTTAKLYIAAHGGRHVNIFSLSLPSTPTAPTPLPLSLLPRFSAWTMACKIQLDNNVLVAAVGLSDNSVEMYEIDTKTASAHRRSRQSCTTRCLLYSMDIYMPQHETCCYIAGGTIFLDIVVWTAVTGSATTQAAQEEERSVLFVLKGHEGSIHTVKWGPLGKSLASGSDDRMVLLWKLSLSSTLSTTTTIKSPTHALHGHVSRLWNSCFNPDETILVSASEDGTCRFWDVSSSPSPGQSSTTTTTTTTTTSIDSKQYCIGTLMAHRFRGVWHCCLDRARLITAGADGSIKVWNLWDVLDKNIVQNRLLPHNNNNNHHHQHHQGGTGIDGCCWELRPLQGRLPDPSSTQVGWHSGNSSITENSSNKTTTTTTTTTTTKKKFEFDSKSECVRCVCLSRDHATLFIATNQGLIHQVTLPVAKVGSSSPFSPSYTSSEEGIEEERWVTIYKATQRRPITSLSFGEGSTEEGRRRLAGCTISGHACALVWNDDDDDKDSTSFSVWEWEAASSSAERNDDGGENDNKILGVYVVDEMPWEWVFTTSRGGGVCLWKLTRSGVGGGGGDGIGGGGMPMAVVAAVARCPLYKSTMICSLTGIPVALSSSSEYYSAPPPSSCWLIGVGTSCGGVVLWRLELGNDAKGSCSFTQVSCIRDAAHCTPVRSISILPSSSLYDSNDRNCTSAQLELYSGGSNGVLGMYSIGTGGVLSFVREERAHEMLIMNGIYDTTRIGRKSVSGGGENGKIRRKEERLIFGYQTTYFLIWDTIAEAQVCSVPVGTWKRPWTVRVDGPHCVTLCYDCSEDKRAIMMYVRRGEVGGEGGLRCAPHKPPFALIPPGNSREINVVRSLGEGRGWVTGGEDGSLRRFMSNVDNDGDDAHIEWMSAHVMGTIVKAIDVVECVGGGLTQPNDPVHTLMVTVGSQQTAMAWQFMYKSSNGSSATDSLLSSRLIGIHAPPSLFMRKNKPEGRPDVHADARYLCVSVVVSASTTSTTWAFVVVGSSTGKIEVLALPVSHSPSPPGVLDDGEGRDDAMAQQQPWEVVAILDYHRTPVLSIDTVTSPSLLSVQGEKEERQLMQVMAFSGGTDGTVVVWDLTACLHTFLQQKQQQKQGYEPVSPPSTPARLHPRHTIPFVHQSGINGLSCATVGPSQTTTNTNGWCSHKEGEEVVVCVTAGDDQAITVTTLHVQHCTDPTTSTVERVHQYKEGNAHASAVRDVWTNGRKAWSVGLDQRCRQWDLVVHHSDDDDSSNIKMEMKESGCVMTQVVEPASLCVINTNKGDPEMPGVEGDDASVAVAVAGRGLHIIQRWE